MAVFVHLTVLSVRPVDMLTTEGAHSYLVVGGCSMPVSVMVVLEVTVEVTVDVVESLEVGVWSSCGKMSETVTHDDSLVDVVVNGHSVTVIVDRYCQMVESEGFTLTVFVAHDTAVVVVTAWGSISATGAVDARPENQQIKVKNRLKIILSTTDSTVRSTSDCWMKRWGMLHDGSNFFLSSAAESKIEFTRSSKPLNCLSETQLAVPQVNIDTLVVGTSGLLTAQNVA
jgi:hypothetical protein